MNSDAMLSGSTEPFHVTASQPGGRHGERGRWAWVPLPLLLSAILILRVINPTWSFDPPWLLFTLNFVFATLSSVVIIFLLSRSFLASGSPGLLLLNCGVVFWGLAGATSAAVGGTDYNASLTIHNVCAWLAALCHLPSVTLLNRRERTLNRRGWWLLTALVLSTGTVALVATAAVHQWTPLFFVQGKGGTLVRFIVLGATSATFMISGLVLHAPAAPKREFARWYAFALFAFAIGIFGLMIQTVHGGALGWTARSTQWVGGIYLVLAAVAAVRESGSVEMFVPISPGNRLLRYALALVFVAAAVTVRMVFLPMLDYGAVTVTFFPALILAALYGGRGPGLLAIALSVLSIDFFWMEPFNTFKISETSDWLLLVIFTAASVLTVWVADGLQKSRERLSMIEAQAQVALEQQRADVKIHAIEQRLAGVLETMTDGFATVTPDGCISTMNQAAREILSSRNVDPAQLIGKTLWQTFPELSGTDLERLYRRAMTEREPAFAEKFYEAGQSWYAFRIFPAPDGGLSVFFVDVTERKKAEAQLATHAAELEQKVAERTAKLQELVTELEHVSYSITHDMRAPLRAMTSFAEILLDPSSELSPAEVQEYLQRILTSGIRLDKLIQDALHYTKAVLQARPVGPVDLSNLFRSLLDSYPNLGTEAADIFIEGELPAVCGNESLLTQCFSNLLGNAVKFVEPGAKAKVRIRAERHNGYARIWIEDSGIGIAREAQHRLFGMFQRLDGRYEGTGIGLAIVRKVAERMGGKVGVESELGKGSRFWVELPLA